MNRRQFINKSAAVLALGSIANEKMFAASAPPPAPNKGRIGIQLYSVRNDLPRDFVGTLKKLSDIGYSAVELYGFNAETVQFLNRPIKEIASLVSLGGMSISSTHAGSGMFPEDTNDPRWDYWKIISNQIKSVGGEWAISASLPMSRPGPTTLDDYRRIAAHFNRTGEVCKRRGVRFAFHNHHEVFDRIQGEVPLEFLIKNTDPELVSFQLDMGHTVRGGGNILNLLRTYPKRFPLWHASDYHATDKVYTNLGQGSVPYKEMFNLPEITNLEHLTVEQESTEGDIFEKCKIDFDFLKQFKWTGVL